MRTLIKSTVSIEAGEEGLQAQAQGVSTPSPRRMTGRDWCCFTLSPPILPDGCAVVHRAAFAALLFLVLFLAAILTLVAPFHWLPVAVHSPVPLGCLSPPGNFLDATVSWPSTALPLICGLNLQLSIAHNQSASDLLFKQFLLWLHFQSLLL